MSGSNTALSLHIHGSVSGLFHIKAAADTAHTLYVYKLASWPIRSSFVGSLISAIPQALVDLKSGPSLSFPHTLSLKIVTLLPDCFYYQLCISFFKAAKHAMKRWVLGTELHSAH